MASIEVCPPAGRPQRLGGDQMIVVGVDVHKHSPTAVAVAELDRPLAEHTDPVDGPSSAGRARWPTSGSGRSRTAGM